MEKIRMLLQGKKVYLTAAIGVLGALAAWSDGQISGTGMLATLWGALQACFLRSALSSEVKKATDGTGA